MPKSYSNSRMKPEMEATVGQWEYIHCSCMIEGPGFADFPVKCQACGFPTVRYTHTLKNQNSGRELYVGVDCATILVGGFDDIPTLAENETKRKERWRRDRFDRPGVCKTTIDDLIERGKL